MTYVSHAVRSLADEPASGERDRLVVTLAEDASADDVGRAVAERGGEVVRPLPFDRLLVEVDRSAVGEVPDIEGVTVVETNAVIDHP